MNISNVPQQQNTQFTAIKRIKCNTKELNEFLQKNKEILNTNNGFIFKNKSPEHAELSKMMIKVAEQEHSSLEWLNSNCKRHGINTPDIDEAPLYVFTEGSIFKLVAYNLKNAFKALFSSYNIQKEAIDTNFPKHLLNIRALSQIADENLPKFEKFLKKNNVEDCTLEELLNFLKK